MPGALYPLGIMTRVYNLHPPPYKVSSTITIHQRETEAHRAAFSAFLTPHCWVQGRAGGSLALSNSGSFCGTPLLPPTQEALTLPGCTNSLLLQREAPGLPWAAQGGTAGGTKGLRTCLGSFHRKPDLPSDSAKQG